MIFIAVIITFLLHFIFKKCALESRSRGFESRPSCLYFFHRRSGKALCTQCLLRRERVNPQLNNILLDANIILYP